MRLAIVLGLCVASMSAASAQPSKIASNPLEGLAGTEAPEVDVMTFGVGERIFERFGHAAVCLFYRASGRPPICFNYGVTDFAAIDALVWGFLRSHQIFWVEVERWESMIAFYEREDRDIWEQKLTLTPEQARAVERKIADDIEEAHRSYIYDHFVDNCTTRLRDLIDGATGGKLRVDSDEIFPLTYRELVLRGLAEFPRLVALSDFVIGRRLDAHPSVWQAMFHPDVLREQIAVKLATPPVLLYKRQSAAYPTEGSSDRLPMLGIALVFVVPLIAAVWRRRFVRAALAWSTLYLVFWGVVLWTLVIVSSIPAIRWNEAVFVFTPLDVALPFLGGERRRRYARVRVVGLLLVSALCSIGILHQPLWVPILSAIVPLGLAAFAPD